MTYDSPSKPALTVCFELKKREKIFRTDQAILKLTKVTEEACRQAHVSVKQSTQCMCKIAHFDIDLTVLL